MKLFVKISLLLLLPAFAKAQSPQTELDSLHRAVKLATNDTSRMHAFSALGSYYDDLNLDSAEHYTEKAITIARQLQLKLDEAELNASLSFSESKMGNYPRSLKLLNMALEMVDNQDNKKYSYVVPNGQLPNDVRLGLKGWINLGFAFLYHYSGNYRKAILYATEYKKISEILKDLDGLAYSYSEMGNAYLKLNMPDSALYFNKIGLDYGLAAAFKKYLGITYIQMGETYLQKADTTQAMINFEKAIEVSARYNKPILVGEAQLKVASLFQSQKQFDSALYHSKQALAVLLPGGKEKSTAIAYRTISDCYRSLGMRDSSFVYLRLATELNDRLDKAEKEKIRELQAAGFEEALRVQALEKERIETQNKNRINGLIAGLTILSIIGFILYRNNRQKQKANKVLESTLINLKSTQAQLIQSEKMASLGELTAGIAHEIQNPLNFVNNFSEVNTELIEELKNEKSKLKSERDEQLEDELLNDIAENEKKINHHGKRADAIVKSMLQHSQTSTGQKEPTDINKLSDEYLRLSYHGLLAKDKSFNATLKTDFDETIGNINIIPQDIGRVLLNLYNNAFYATNEKSKQRIEYYEPIVSVSTKKVDDKVLISVKDNGNGIPQKIVEKIFQPFFTTKPTGQGTGLGLSLSYDIVKAHGGELKVETKVGGGSTFIIQLPV